MATLYRGDTYYDNTDVYAHIDQYVQHSADRVVQKIA
jgi:hypothetical protein